MWFEILLDFITSLLPSIQNTSLSIMNFLTYTFTLPGIDLSIIGVQILETQIVVGEILFGSSLVVFLTLSIWAFILKLIPIV